MSLIKYLGGIGIMVLGFFLVLGGMLLTIYSTGLGMGIVIVGFVLALIGNYYRKKS